MNIAILKPFLCFRSLTYLIMRLNDDVIFISLLFSFLYSLNHIQLSLFMLSEVNIAILRPFLSFRCLTKFIIRFNDEVIIISFLFRFLHCLNHIQLPLFMLRVVNIGILRPFLSFRCLTKLIVRLNHNVIFISLLFRFLYSLIHSQLSLFMLREVNIAILRPFLCSRCLTNL